MNLDQLKNQLREEKQQTAEKYIALGLVPFAGLTEETEMTPAQERLHASLNVELSAIEERYKIAAGQ